MNEVILADGIDSFPDGLEISWLPVEEIAEMYGNDAKEAAMLNPNLKDGKIPVPARQVGLSSDEKITVIL